MHRSAARTVHSDFSWPQEARRRLFKGHTQSRANLKAKLLTENHAKGRDRQITAEWLTIALTGAQLQGHKVPRHDGGEW